MNLIRLERFAERFKIMDTPCWVWTYNLNNSGYGSFNPSKEEPMAHRTAYKLIYGEIPQGLELDHLCRNRSCVNPKHLEPVTRSENHKRGKRPLRRVYCLRGHEFTKENTYLWGRVDKKRICKTCYWLGVNKRRTIHELRVAK